MTAEVSGKAKIKGKKKRGFFIRLIKTLLWTGAALFLFLATIVIVYWQTDWLESAAASYLNRALDGKGKVNFSAIEGALINHIMIYDLDMKIENSVNVKAKSIDLRYDLWPLLYNKIRVSLIKIDEIKVKLYTSDTEAEEEQSAFDKDSLLALLEKPAIFRPVLDALPNLKIDNVQLSIGELCVEDKPLTLKDLEFHLNQLSADSSRIHVNCKQLSAKWYEKNVEVKQVEFNAEMGEDYINLSRLSLKTKESDLSLGGNLRTGFRNSFNMEVFESRVWLKDLIDMGVLPEEENGFSYLELSISGNSQRLNIYGGVKGQWRRHRISRFDFKGGYDGSGFTIETLDARVDWSALQFAGQWHPDRILKGKLLVHNIRIEEWADMEDDFHLTGKIDANFKPFRWKNLTGKANLLLYDSHFAGLDADTVRLDLTAQKGQITVLPATVIQITDSVRFNFEGTIENNGEIDLSVNTFDMKIASLMESLKQDTLKGYMDGHFRAYGPVKDPSISGLFTMPFFEKDSILLNQIRFDLFARDVFSKRQGTADFSIRSADIEKFPMKDIMFHAEFEGDTLLIPQITLYNEDNTLKAGMRIVKNLLDIDIDFNNFTIDYGNYWLKNDGDLSFVIDSAYVSLESFKLQGPESSSIEVSGFIDRINEDAQLYMNINDIKVDHFNQFWDNNPLIAGTIDGTAELIDPFNDPNVSVDIQLENFFYNRTKLGNVTAEFSYGNSNIQISEFNYDDYPSHLNFSGNLAMDFSDETKPLLDKILETQMNLSMEWNNVSLAKFAPVLDIKKRFSGLLSGYLEVEGSASKPVVRSHLNANGFHYGNISINNMSAFAQYNSGYVSLDSLSLDIMKTQMQMNGWLNYDLSFENPDTNFFDNTFALYFYTREDTLTLLSLFNEQIERITGDIETELYLGGTLEKPAVEEGFIRINNGEALLSRIKDPISNVQVDISIQDSLLTFNKFQGYSKKKLGFLEKIGNLIQVLIPGSGSYLDNGLLGLEGSILLSDLMRPDINLEIDMTNFYIDYFIENTKLMLHTDNLSIAGRDTILISGVLDIPEGVYEVDLAQMEKNVYLTSKQIKLTPPYIAMELDIHIPGNFIITSSALNLTNNFKVEIAGDLQITQEAGHDLIQISGLVEVPSGEYNAWNQNFKIQTGSIHFKDPTRMNPELNIVATKQIGSRVFELTISGELDKWQQDIRVLENGRELPLSQADKITLLTLGADVGQVTGSADSTFMNIGEEVLTTAFLTAIERGAEKYTGLDKIKIQTEESMVDLRKGRLNNGLDDATISFGKFITSDLYIEYQTRFGARVPTPQLSWDTGNRLGLKYRINKFWSFDSQYEKTIQGNNKVQIGISWEYSF